MRANLVECLANVVAVLRGRVHDSGALRLGVQLVPARAEPEDRPSVVQRRVADVEIQPAKALNIERPRVAPVADHRGSEHHRHGAKEGGDRGRASGSGHAPQRGCQREDNQGSRRPHERREAEQKAARRRSERSRPLSGER